MPRKLGQHFLVNQSILENLAVAACGEHVPRVVEIGPGRAALTAHLLPRTDELHVLELDDALVAYLRAHFLSEPKVHVHHGDVLTTDLAQWGPAVITGNLPYYITSPIVDRFLQLGPQFPRAVFLMQAEVADRVTAKPGSRDYGYLSVSAQLICDVEIVCKAPPGAFAPPPKVDSAAVRLTRHGREPANLPNLLKFVGRCFAQKRKTLRNNLRPFYGSKIDNRPEANLRAEQIEVTSFAPLYEAMEGGDFVH